MPEYVTGFRNTFGTTQSFPFTADNDAHAQEKVQQQPSWETIQRESRPLHKGKPTPIRSIRATKPSRLEKFPILLFFKKIINLLDKLWPHRSPSVDYRLFHDLTSSNEFLRTSNAKAPVPGIRVDTKTSLTDVLAHTLAFLKKERKRERVPPSLLKELSQCRRWAKTIENLSSSTNAKKRTAHLHKMSNAIVQAMCKLRPESSLLIPGGFHSAEEGDLHALYRATKNQDGTYKLEIISQDPRLQDHMFLAIGGKNKITETVTFSRLQQKEVHNSIWWERLLSLQLPSTDSSNAELPVKRSSLTGLFAPFSRYFVPTEQKAHNFSTPKNLATHSHNIAALINQTVFPNEKKGERRERFFFRHQLDTLFSYFGAVYREIPKNTTHQLLLEEGIQNISRKASLLHQRGMLKEDEIQYVNTELLAIERVLNRAKRGQPIKKGKNFFKGLPKPSRYPFSYSTKTLKKIEPKGVLPSLQGDGTPDARQATPLPADSTPISAKPLDPIHFTDLSPPQIMQKLHTLREECNQLFQDNRFGLVQKRFEEIILALPLPKNHSDFSSFSYDAAKQASEDIAHLCHLVDEASTIVSSPLPEHVFLMEKATAIQYQLAFAHSNESQIFPEFSCTHLSRTNRIYQRSGKTPPPPWRDPRYQELDCAVRDVLDEMHKRYMAWRSAQRGNLLAMFETKKRTDIHSLAKEAKKSPIIANICAQLKRIDQRYPPTTGKFIHTQQDKQHEEFLSRWLHPTTHTAFRGALGNATVSQGFHSNGERKKDEIKKENRRFSPDDMTPEAICHDPKFLFQQLAKTCQTVRPGESVGMSLLKEENMRDILFLFTEQLTLRQMIGLIQDKPHLLEDPNVRALLYHLPFDRTHSGFYSASFASFQAPLFVKEWRKNPKIFSEFFSFLDRQIPLLHSQGKVLPALLLIDVSNRLKEECAKWQTPKRGFSSFSSEENQKEEQKIRESAKEAKDYTHFLQEWAEEALDPGMKVAEHKNTLWKNLLHSYRDKDHLSMKDLESLLVGRYILASTSANPHETLLYKDHEIRCLLDAWMPVLQKHVDDNATFRNAVLDKICKAQGLPLPQQEHWMGFWPKYQEGHYEIDLQLGTVTNMETGATTKAISIDILRNADANEAFSTPKQALNRIPTQAKVEEEETHFHFHDAFGNASRIVQNKSALRIYKELAIGGKPIALQYIPRREIVPEEFSFDSFREINNVKALLQCIGKWIQQLFTPRFPAFFANKDFRFYANPSKSNQIYVFNADGKPLFALQFSRLGPLRFLSKAADLRNGTDKIRMQSVHLLSKKSHSLWRPFTRFEDSSNILVWRNKKGEVEKIDLHRYQLTFVQQNRQLVCTSPRLKGWVFNPNHQSLQAKKGIASSLVLTHPTEVGKKKILVPHNPLVAGPKSNTNGLFLLLLQVGLSFLRKKVKKIRIPDPLEEAWHFDRSEGQASYLTFDLDPHTLQWDDPSSTTAENYLYLSLLTCYQGHFSRAMEFMEQAKTRITQDPTPEQKELLQQLVQLPIRSPQAVAIRLKAALLNGDSSQETGLATGELYTIYIGYGHKIPQVFRLSRKEELDCLRHLGKVNCTLPLQASQVFADGESQRKARQTWYHKAAWHKKFRPVRMEASELAGQLVRRLQEQVEAERRYASRKGLQHFVVSRLTKDPNQYDVSSRSERLFTHHFGKIYKIARESDKEGEEYRRLQTLVQSYAKENGEIQEPSSIVETLTHDASKEPVPDLLPTLVSYFEVVFSLREQGISSDQLPDYSFVSAEEQEGRNVWSYRQEVEEKNIENAKNLLKKIEELENKHLLNHEKLHRREEEKKNLQKETETFKEKLQKTGEEERLSVENFFGEILEEHKTLNEGGWEDIIQKNKRSSMPVPNTPTPSGGALCSPHEVGSFFRQEQAYSSRVHHVPSLDRLTTSSEPAHHHAANRLREEIETAIQNRKETNRYVLQSEQARQSCLAHVQKTKEQATKKATEAKEKLESLLHRKGHAPENELQKKAGLIPSIEIADVMKAYVQNNFSQVERSLSRDVSLDTVKQEMIAYIDAAAKVARADKALAYLEAMTEGKEGIDPSSSDLVYQILTGERQFSLQEHFHLGVLELYLTFLLRPSQLQTVIAMLKDPNCLRQAITGAGKTTVINFLLSLMKADGTNLATMVYPKPLFEENHAYLHHHLGKLYDKNTYPLRFDENTSLAVTNPRSGGKISYFMKLYEDLYRVIHNKNVVSTTRQSLQSIEKAVINQVHRFHLERGDPKSWDPLEIAHMVYGLKVLHLLHNRMHMSIDEVDSLLSPKQKQDLALTSQKTIQFPLFFREEIVKIFMLLSEHSALGIRDDLQADRQKEQDVALRYAAQKRAAEWSSDTRIQGQLITYFLGRKEEGDIVSKEEEENILAQLETAFSEQDRDRIALAKDLFQTFLPLSLSHNEGEKYKYSEDGTTVFNCRAPNEVGEGSRPQEILEWMSYTAQAYLSQGITTTCIKQQIEKYKARAIAEFNPKGRDLGFREPSSGAGSGKTLPMSENETQAGKEFFAKFGKKLSEVDPDRTDQVANIAANVKQKQEQVIDYLLTQLGQLEDHPSRISCTSNNFVSMAKHVGGDSATIGNLHAYHKTINTQNVMEKGTTGEMILHLQEKTNWNHGKTFPFHPAKPVEKIREIVAQHGGTSFIDGGIAVRGHKAEAIAKEIFHHLPKKSPIKAVAFFGKGDRIQYQTRNGLLEQEEADFSPRETSVALLGAHARGANVILGAKNRYIATYNGRIDLATINQSSGRSRLDSQEIAPIVPEGEGLETVDDIIVQGAREETDRMAEDLLRHKKDEIDDTVRSAMLRSLGEKASALSMKESADILVGAQDIVNLYTTFQSREEKFLVQQNTTDYNQDGVYWNLHKALIRKDKIPAQVLFEKAKTTLEAIQPLAGLDSAKTSLLQDASLHLLAWYCGENDKRPEDCTRETIENELEQWLQGEHPLLVDWAKKQEIGSLLAQFPAHWAMMQQMPRQVEGLEGAVTGVDVEVDTEVDTEVEVEVDVEKDLDKTPNRFLPWLFIDDKHYRDHKYLAGNGLYYSENWHPLNRTNWADPVYQRQLFDKAQMPAHYLLFTFAKSTKNLESCKIVDPRDVVHNTHRNRDELLPREKNKENDDNSIHVYYDMRAHEVFLLDEEVTSDGYLQQILEHVAVARFLDGQIYRIQYTKKQWKALKNWIRSKNNPKEIEKFLLGKVLRNRGDLASDYPKSDIYRLIHAK